MCIGPNLLGHVGLYQNCTGTALQAHGIILYARHHQGKRITFLICFFFYFLKKSFVRVLYDDVYVYLLGISCTVLFTCAVCATIAFAASFIAKMNEAHSTRFPFILFFQKQ